MDKKLKSEIALREEKTLAFWKKNHIFEKSLAKPSPKGGFIVYEGPPTANGRPAIHHLEARAFKDAIPRYKTMCGYHVRRRAGWDTHGLPVELEIEKELKFSGKKDIEQYGIAAFNKKCRESVLKYINEWQKFTDRIGYWVDQSKAYFTYDATYIESVWSILKHIQHDGRLYKDYKIVPWCTRCGTALSSHELAQGYQEVKDLTVTVKFKVIGKQNTSFLAWTTTPWTLAGNVALAVGAHITYVTVEKKEKDTETPVRFILAKERLSTLFGEGEYVIIEEQQGSELVGMKYEPVYPFIRELATAEEEQKFKKAFHVYEAPFVSTEEGTGIVHIAVMYGQDDFELGTKVGLPKVHVVAPDGLFVTGTGFFEGRFAKDEELTVDIIKDLAKKEALFAKEKHEHTYPFCWRCKTPLIYYARDSWYIRMQDLREEMVAQNKHIHWEPEHIREGRFGDWIAGAKDWAISRERYWGTPLPVWKNSQGNECVVIGSLQELADRTKGGHNTYLTVRHGESESNVAGVTSTTSATAGVDHLTEKGRAQVQKTVEILKSEDPIDFIFTSPFARTRETAMLIAKELNIPDTRVIFEDRLREIHTGTLDGKPLVEYEKFFSSFEERFTHAPEGGETLNDVRKRVGALFYELETRYKGKRILLVSHGRTIWALRAVSNGLSSSDSAKLSEPNNAEVTPLDFKLLPHNENYELDPHRPYIDDVVLQGKQGEDLRRVSEVIDVWFDSGAMPFASEHYPFENKEWVEGPGYPADFISEAIDQTRGWFYTLLAIGTLVGRGTPYKNVISLGHLQDKNGQKMSKSKGNVVNPQEAMDRWGVDTLRLWMYSVNQPGEAKSFDEKTIREVARVLSWFENSTKFYELFKKETKNEIATLKVIDRWMILRTQETVQAVTKYFEAYKYFEGARAIAGLLEDLSQWYVRRIRDRAREGDVAALETLRTTLKSIALISAPLTPFIAEYVYQSVRSATDVESVHLAAWPQERKRWWAHFLHISFIEDDNKLLAQMSRVRTLASEALMLRQKGQIKVRQPLATLSITGTLSADLATMLSEEVNVKCIKMHASKLTLDTHLNKELIREGDLREFMRALAQARKAQELSPKDHVRLSVSENARELLKDESLTGVSSVSFDTREDAPYSVKLSSQEVHFFITNHAT